MKRSHSTERERQERPHNNDNDSLASSVVSSVVSSHEIKSVFAEQREYLYWTSLVITGDDAIAEQAMVNASDLSAHWSGVFRDWVLGWANHVTVQARSEQSTMSFPRRRSAMRIRPVKPPTTMFFRRFFPTIRSRPFGASIPETSLPHSTLWPVPRWCFGECNTHRLPIARFCWTCPAKLLLAHTARLSDGTASAPAPI